MRIAIASTGLGHVNRGIEAWAADLGRLLADRAADVRLYKGAGPAKSGSERTIGCWKRGDARTERFLKLMPRWMAWRLGLGTGYEVEQTTFAVRLLRCLAQDQADLLHTQDPQLAMIVQRANRLGIVKTRVILGHGTEEPPEFLRRLDYVQHLAPWHLEEARRAGAWKPTWTAIPNFIDPQCFTPVGNNIRAELGIPEQALVVLTAAAIKRQHKRIDYLVEEFAHLRDVQPDLPVWLVIAGGWESQTDELVQWGRTKLGDRVRFLVRFPRHRMADLYRSADVFALCSLKEMMPIALLEAAASGLPCIVHRHPVAEWMIGPGGKAIDMADRGALSGTLAALLIDGAERAKLGASSRQHCIENFGHNRVVTRILDYYKFVLAWRATGTGFRPLGECKSGKVS